MKPICNSLVHDMMTTSTRRDRAGRGARDRILLKIVEAKAEACVPGGVYKPASPQFHASSTSSPTLSLFQSHCG